MRMSTRLEPTGTGFPGWVPSRRSTAGGSLDSMRAVTYSLPSKADPTSVMSSSVSLYS